MILWKSKEGSGFGRFMNCFLVRLLFEGFRFLGFFGREGKGFYFFKVVFVKDIV